MADVQALLILSTQVQNIKHLPEPPLSFDCFDAYNSAVQQVCQSAQEDVQKVNLYVKNIEEKLNDLRNGHKSIITKNQEAIKKIFGSYQIVTGPCSPSPRYLQDLQLAHALQTASQSLLNDRLSELINETEAVCAKVKNGAALSLDDIVNLTGCLESWQKAKVDSHEQEEKKKKEEEEKRRTEEEQKKQREIEEAEKRAEEERKRMKEEELRKEREAEERKKKEEEARKRQEEAKKREEEEKKRQLNPANWKPIVLKRPSDEVSGRIRGEISCILTSPTGGITENDFECTSSDEIDSIIDILRDEERPVSSLIDIKSKKGSLKCEPSSRVFVPHIPALGSDEEIVVKTSVNGSDWVTSPPLLSTINVAKHEKSSLKMAGFEVNNFTTLKAIVVSRPRCQTIEVDQFGASMQSSVDKNIKLIVPRDTFQGKTVLRLTVEQLPNKSLTSLPKDSPLLQNVLSVSAFVRVDSQTMIEKSLELDFSHFQKDANRNRGKPYQLYAGKDKAWKFADVEYRSKNDDLAVTLPSGETNHIIIELVVPPTVSKESILEKVSDLYSCMRSTHVRMIVKQKMDEEGQCVVRVVQEEQWKDVIQLLAESGYTAGPDLSAPFSLQEGQVVQITCSGNVEREEKMSSPKYFSFLGGVHENLTLKVVDTWKQKDMPSFVGSILCSVLNDKNSVIRTVELQVSIPKRKRATADYKPVRFPYYLFSLACFLSKNVCKEGDVWQAVLSSIFGDAKYKTIHRNVKRKVKESSPEMMCKAMLLDWMKGQAAHEDKIVPVLKALEIHKLKHIADSCHDFVHYHKDNLTDEAMKAIASGTTKEVRTLGKDLDLDKTEVERCINEHTNNKQEQKLALLMVWRESDNVVKYGMRALDHLKKVCA